MPEETTEQQRTPLEQAEQLIAETCIAVSYTIEITKEYLGDKYAIDIAEVTPLSQWFIPVHHLPLVVKCVLDQLLALGPVDSEGYQERLADLKERGFVQLYPEGKQC